MSSIYVIIRLPNEADIACRGGKTLVRFRLNFGAPHRRRDLGLEVETMNFRERLEGVPQTAPSL